MLSESPVESESSDSDGSTEDPTANRTLGSDASRRPSDDLSDDEDLTSGDENGAQSQEDHADQLSLDDEEASVSKKMNSSQETATRGSGNDSPISHDDAMDTDHHAEEPDVLSQKSLNVDTGSANGMDMPTTTSISRRSSSAIHAESEGQTDDLSSEIETDDSAEVESSMTYRQWKMLHGEPARIKKLRKKVGYRDAYRQMLNDEIDRASRFDLQDESSAVETYNTSQIGMMVWTDVEKSAFFDAIALRGRDDLRFIAKQTGKSQIEVRQVILLLEQGVAQSMTKTVDDTGYSYDQIPAAVELSDQLCDRLEEAADTIARYQQKQETNLEANKHGDEWLIDWELSKTLEEKFDGIEAETLPRNDDQYGRKNSPPGNSGPLTSCNLLHPRNFIRLSSRVFMSHEDPARDWGTYDKYGPAIHMTAMQDLQQLVVSLTTRIVYTAAIQCLSRIRAAGDAEEATPKAIRKADVLTALHMLNLQLNSKSYWAELPSRLGLTCFWNKRVSRDQTVTGYMVPARDAENWLLQKNGSPHAEGMQRIIIRSHHKDHLADADAGPGLGTDKPVRDLQKQGGEARGSAVNPPEEFTGGNFRPQQSQSEVGSSDEDSQSSESSADVSSGEEDEENKMLVDDTSLEKAEQPTIRKFVAIHDLEDAARIRDKMASRAEEDRLWHLLGLQPPTSSRPNLPIDIKVNDRSRRRETALQHQDDWRLNTAYRPQWSTTLNTDLKRKLEEGEENVRKRHKPIDSSTVINVGAAKYGSSSIADSDESLAESSSDEHHDSSAIESATDSQNPMRSRRTSLPRRSSQAALENLEASLDARSLVNNDLSSSDDYTPG